MPEQPKPEDITLSGFPCIDMVSKRVVMRGITEDVAEPKRSSRDAESQATRSIIRSGFPPHHIARSENAQRGHEPPMRSVPNFWPAPNTR